MRLLRSAEYYKELRDNVPEEELLRYGADCDSMYALLDSLFDMAEDSMDAFTHDAKDSLLTKAFDWQAYFLHEIAQQTKPFGLTAGFHIFGGQLVQGDRLVCVGPIPGTTS